MATIEPRLIHLLNSAAAPSRPLVGLPPIQPFPLPNPFARRLPPLEPDAGQHAHGPAPRAQPMPTPFRADAPARAPDTWMGSLLPPSDLILRPIHLPTAHESLSPSDVTLPQLAMPHAPVFHSYPPPSSTAGLQPVRSYSPPPIRSVARMSSLSTSGHPPLVESLPSLSNPPPVTNPPPLASNTLPLDPALVRRECSPPAQRDDVQLPQPSTKCKSKPRQQAVPPIINGLHEPPPDPALFPPIFPGLLDDGDDLGLESFTVGSVIGENDRVLPDYCALMNATRPALLPKGGKRSSRSARKRKRPLAARTRNKWTEDETKELFRGVSRHGVGNWTVLLKDSDFKFNERSAMDLKDRWRTCCPLEFYETKYQQDKREAKKAAALCDPSRLVVHGGKSIIPLADMSKRRTGSLRLERKNMEDLEAMGIMGPLKWSSRRERTAWSIEDDAHILEGVRLYGAAWSKIQRDPRFNLLSRQPTDLRDRVRNKFPKAFASIEKVSKGPNGSKLVRVSKASKVPKVPKRSGTNKDPFEPTAQTLIETTVEPMLCRSAPTAPDGPPVSSDNGENIPSLSTNAAVSASSSSFTPGGNMGEIGIARLLLYSSDYDNGWRL